MNWTLALYRRDDGCRTVLVGEIARTRLPLIYVDAVSRKIKGEPHGELRVLLRWVPATEQRYLGPVIERSHADPIRRFRGLARRAGVSTAAKAALEL